MSAPVVILGLGAQAKYVAETYRLLGRELLAVYDGADEAALSNFAGLDVRGGLLALLSDFEALGRPEMLVCCPDNSRKEALVQALEFLHPVFATAMHPRAVVATNALLEGGTIVNACAVIQPFARVGAHAMIHAGVVLEHDCVVEPFANIAPGAVLAGHVRVGRGATVFAGATVIPGVSIGARAVVAAGAVVTRDVPDGGWVAGIPATAIPMKLAPEETNA
jgi:sugar O-acyltransferase (sialic acid O-acetyltransferase NeuD family)